MAIPQTSAFNGSGLKRSGLAITDRRITVTASVAHGRVQEVCADAGSATQIVHRAGDVLETVAWRLRISERMRNPQRQTAFAQVNIIAVLAAALVLGVVSTEDCTAQLPLWRQLLVEAHGQIHVGLSRPDEAALAPQAIDPRQVPCVAGGCEA